MKTIVLYLGMAVAGYLLAIPMRSKNQFFAPIGPTLKVIVTTLVFVMGFRIAANKEIVSNIGVIGLHSLILMLGSLICTIAALHLARRLMGFDHYGYPKKEGYCSREQDRVDSEKVPFWRGSPFRMAVAVLLGAMCGYISGIVFELYNYNAMYQATGLFVTYALYLMVFLVGIDIGSDEKAIRLLKKAGARVLLFPLVTAASTVAFMLLCCTFMPYTCQEMLSIACTFCWYSLGPSIIMDAGFIVAGAVAFLANFTRVIITLIALPLVARNVGYIETIGMSQAAAMDVCIATIGEATNRQTVMYAFASGVIFTVAVPLLIPLIVGM